MSRYRKIETRTWSDEKFGRLSPMPPSGQCLWLFLMVGPHTGPIPGLFRAGRAGMAEELGWEVEAFDEAFGEVFQQGMAKADFKARLVWLPNALKHNRPESPNVVRSWRVELDLLPECELKREAIEHIREHLENLGPSYVAAFDECLGGCSEKPSSKPSRKPMPKPSAKAMANQEQEQEQEQKSSAPSAKSPKGSRLPADWTLPDEWREWGKVTRPDLDIDLTAERFRDFWLAKAGKDGVKLDWQATWRNWVRNERSIPSGRGAQTTPVGVFV